MWRMGFKSNIIVTNWRNWKKTGKKNKAVRTGRNNCINTVWKTSSQLGVPREVLWEEGMTIWTQVSVKLLSTRQTSRLEQMNRTVACISHRVILPLYWASAKLQLQYYILTWALHLKKKIRQLEQVQRRATGKNKTQGNTTDRDIHITGTG